MSGKKQKTGKRGEALARKHLEKQGMQVIAENWRYGRREIDLIAQQDDILIFVEVKTRSYEYYGSPGHFLSPEQESRIATAAFAFCEEADYAGEVRFDLIEVILPPNAPHQLTHYPDAFYPGDDGW